MNTFRTRPLPAIDAAAPLAGDAVVIGGSITGLSAARILAGYFERVTILERDALPGPADFRPGVPQARHAHTLLPEGQTVFEQLFPGLTEELVTAGAVPVDAISEMAIFVDGAWRAPKNREAGRRVVFSRPLLEAALRGRLAAHPNVVFLASQDVVGLRADAGRGRVTGVRLRRRGALGDGVEEFPADLVFDASGRGSQAPRWLAGLGYAPPRETGFTTHTGYATRLYRRPAGFDEGWKILYIRPRPPAGTLGGLILPIEHGRWLVTLIGMARDYPPADIAGFEAFARRLPSPRFFEALRLAEPLDEPFGYQLTESRLRRFDRLPRYLDGFLVGGDAVMTLNPVYALGMTAAALGGLVLDECLQPRRGHPAADRLPGLAGAYHARLNEKTARLWTKVTMEDARWPMVELLGDGLATDPRSIPDLVTPQSLAGAVAGAAAFTPTPAS
jgi:2-polyprenyl-6-methoxyphenol hydroxylase-like FAD-dependent oxidoreductase